MSALRETASTRRLRGAPEPEVAFAVADVGKITSRSGQRYPAAVPRASPFDVRRAGLWTGGVLLRARLVVVGVPPIFARLPHVSAGIQQTVGAGPGRTDPDSVVACLTPIAPEHRALGARRLASPGKQAAVGPAGRLLPFGLGGEPATHPLTVGLSLVPPYESHREIVMDTPIRIRWKRTPRRGCEALETTYGQGELVHEEGRNINGVR